MERTSRARTPRTSPTARPCGSARGPASPGLSHMGYRFRRPLLLRAACGTLPGPTPSAASRRASAATVASQPCARSRSSPSGSPALGSPVAMREPSRRGRLAQPPTSRGTLRWSLSRRDITASLGRATTKRPTAAISSSLTSCGGAIHALAPADFGLYGRALIATDDDDLAVQLGRQVQRLAAEKGFAPTDALDEVAEATKDALGRGRALTKTELHDQLRERVGADLMPWCKGLQEPPRCADAVALWRHESRGAARLQPPVRAH